MATGRAAAKVAHRYDTVSRLFSRLTSDARDAFYQVHWYVYPLLAWMNLLTDLACMTPETFDVLYITEGDPLWDDDELAFLLNPEAVLFANPSPDTVIVQSSLSP